MDKRELQAIMDLMEELKEKMEFGEEDFSKRLGREKPQVEIVKMEGEMPMESEDMEMSEEDAMETDSDESPAMSDMMAEEMSPEEKLKQRLMKMRG